MGETNIGALTSGLLKISVAAGVATPATAVPGVDYSPVGTPITPTAAEIGLVHAANTGSFDSRLNTLEADLGDGSDFVSLQATTPGTAQTGNANLSGTVKAGAFSGPLTGAVTGNADTATAAGTVTVVDDTTTNATMYPLWVTNNTGNLPVKLSSSKLSFNPSTSALAAVTFSGTNINGNYGNFSVNLNNNVNSMTTTSTDGTTIGANQVAVVGTPVRMSPRLRFSGYAWNTGGTPASKLNSWIMEVLPTGGVSPTTSVLRIANAPDGAASYTYLMDITQAGKFSGLPETNGPTGTCTLAGTGNTTTAVSNTCVSAGSRIFLMPTSDTAAASVGSATGVWVSTKTAATSFTITHPDTADTDRTFDYWIVN
jgi:hypothetical protein